MISRRRPALHLASAAATTVAFAWACGGTQPEPAPPLPPPADTAPPTAPTAEAPDDTPTSAEADEFVATLNKELKDLWTERERIAWVKSTHITYDTQLLEAKSEARVMKYLTKRIKDGRRFEGLELKPETARTLHLLKFSAGLPAPDNAAERNELAQISSELDGMYGKGKYCSKKLIGKGLKKGEKIKGDQGCRTLGQLSDIVAKSKDYELLEEAWTGWRTIAKPMRKKYTRFVTLGNKGARELGFQDMGDIWKGRYDMSGEDFLKEMDRLWLQVKPLYDQLHCYTRARLRKEFGEKRIGKRAPIPAHLLGNMWAQEWSKLYERVIPYKGKGQPNLTKQLKKKKYNGVKMVKLAERFFTSLGMDKLPSTFWERSQFSKPRDREVVCHASAWDVGMEGDLRIKMCIKVDEEDLITIHHELGHNYYFHYYKHQPVMFKDGANDGFHEGIGDTLALAVTPAYLKEAGLLDRVVESKEADINLLMRRALDGIAFLPFGKLIDQWRFDVFSGKVSPGNYNAHWWKLRHQFQGIAPPSPRGEEHFDPGAKYHIPANVPYTRYFIARILQYQFLRALCKEAGHTGPLYKCSFYGNKKAGQKMMAMLRLGSSKPWPDALEAISGERQMDASAIIDYYKPLMAWMKEQTKGESCGWD